MSTSYFIDKSSNSSNKYPSPFFDMSRTYMPKNIKTLFKHCRIFFYRNEFLRSVIGKMVSYPITQPIIEKYADQEEKENWENLLKFEIKLKSLLKKIGLDFMVFGNCIVLLNLKFKRWLTCSSCGEKHQLHSIKDRKFRQFKYSGTCPKCKAQINEFGVDDVPQKTADSVKVVALAPERIEIDYDEFTGEADYFYNVKPELKADVKKGTIPIVDKTPWLFIKAIEANKKIQLDPKNIYHFKQPTLSEDDEAWGKPMILPALGLIYYMQTLRRGNEAIAMEHVVPLRALFPASNGSDNPIIGMNLGEWRSQIEEQIKKWKRDPNHIGIFPIPIGYQSLGGDARALMTTPEMKFLEETVINSFGVPIEFVKGGASWTGSSISLRIVENDFIAYREDLHDFINQFLIPRLAAILSYNKISLRMTKFKMNDDSESKRLHFELNEAGKISNTALLQEFGIDPDKDRDRKEKDIEFENKLKSKVAEGDAAAASIGFIEQGRAQAGAEWAYLDEKARIDEKMIDEELAEEMTKIETGNTSEDTSEIIHKYALQLIAMPPKQQQQVVVNMQKSAPYFASAVMKRAQMIQNAMMAAMPEMIEAEQQSRKQDIDQQKANAQVAKAKQEKHTAPKKGNP